MSYEIISSRLATLQDTNAQLSQLITRLATIKFQPGSVPLDNEEGSVVVELTADIHHMLREQREDFEVLREEVLDLNGGRAGSELRGRKEELEGAVGRGWREVLSLQTAFRRAQLSARRTLEAAQREERRLLLLSYTTESPSTDAPPIQSRRRNQKSENPSIQDKEVNASSDVTAALRRTHDMMASELSRSQFAHDTLKESTAALAQLGETYSTLDTLLSSSKNLLGTLLRSQKSDTWYLETAFYILLATIAWLIWRRLLYGPTWWLVWFPMKILLRTSTSVLTAAGLLGGVSNIEAVSSSLTTQSSVVHNSATGKLSAPAGGNGPPAPSIRVGGGGRGAPMSGPNTPPEQTYAPPGTISEKVGQIIDESRHEQRQYQEDDAHEEEARNPKKRMWEEEVEVRKEAGRNRDEL